MAGSANHAVRCALFELEGRRTNPPFAHAAIADTESFRLCGRVLVATQRISRLRSFIGVNIGQIQTARSPRPGSTIEEAGRNGLSLRLRQWLLLLSGDWLRMNGWLDWRSINFCRMMIEDLHVRRQQSPWLSLGNEYVLTIVRPDLDRIRAVQRSQVYANLVRPPFEGQRQFGTAIRAEVRADVFAASVRGLREDCWGGSGEAKVLFLKNRLDHSIRPSRTLAKLAVANGDPKRFATCVVSHLPAKTASS